MSVLSRISGIHISKHGVHIEPLKALATIATVGSMGGLGPLAAGLSRIPGAAAAIGAAGKIGTAVKALPGATKVAGALTGAKRLLNAGKGGGGGAIDPNDPNIGNANVNMTGGTDWLGLAEGGLAGLSAVNSARASGRAGDLQKQALAQANARWAEGAPLRTQGQARLLNPVTPDLTSIYNDPTNAFSTPVTTAPAPRRRLLPAGG
jgi:hypothetical protein